MGFENITRITQEWENNDLIDEVGWILDNKGFLSEQIQADLWVLRDTYRDSNDIDVTENELHQLKSMLENVVEHDYIEKRVDFVLLVLGEFIEHQRREQKRENQIPVEKFWTLIDNLTPVIEGNKIARNYDVWLEWGSNFIFILIPQKHKNPLSSSLEDADNDVLQVQQREILPLLMILWKNNMCNIAATEWIKLLDGPVSRDRLLWDLPYSPSEHNASLIAEISIPEVDTFWVERENDPGYMLDMIAYLRLVQWLVNLNATEEQLGKLRKKRVVSFTELFTFLNVPYHDRQGVQFYMEARGINDNSTFKEYIDFILKLHNEDIPWQFDQARLVDWNQDIVWNLSQIQKNTNTNCVSLVMWANHFDDLSEMWWKSIQRILRERWISYVTLAPFSVDMEWYDFVE